MYVKSDFLYANSLHKSFFINKASPSIDAVFLPPTADDNATIRVTNLSEDTRETDLQELFRPFGSISRIYLAKDKNTGQSKVSAEPQQHKHTCYLQKQSEERRKQSSNTVVQG